MVLTLSFTSVLVQAQLTFSFTPKLEQAFTKHPPWRTEMKSLETALNKQLQEIEDTLREYKSSNKKIQARARVLLGMTLGAHYDQSSAVREAVFKHIFDNVQHMESTLTLDGVIVPQNPKVFVNLGAGGRIYLTEGFFMDEKLTTWLKVFMLLHEVFRATVPQQTQRFVFGATRDPQTRTFPVTPLFEGGGPLKPGEKEVDGAWNKDFKQILDQPSGVQVMPFNPDLIPLMGYCFTNDGRLPS
ncbi:hypothetical protein CVT24_009291 [Panaeolus cyanescens]|uniref:Uncharacterized protein n=1 Tax=Panaeolus cyanescens TaxID=181874 RepID=A0A409Y8Q3_9AGAR|nr:hypothetical protein CVT24_009291 [Panaeolus cyanescens]